MSRKLLLATVFLLLSCSVGFSQKVDTLSKQLDSMHKVEEPENNPPIDINKTDYTARTNITFKSYFVLLGTDMTQEVTGPFHASKKSWLEVGAFAALEAGLVAFGDLPIQKNTQILMEHNRGAQNVSQYVTGFGASYEVYTLAAFGAYGLIFKSDKVKTTTLLATQSYLAAGAMSYVIKFLTGQRRPNSFTPGNENNLIFLGPGLSSSNNSFNSGLPSGHTTAIFSAATVFADEYHDEVLIPVIAYTAASLVGVSRITQNAHWASEVLAGAALGYVTGKQVVYNYHRYARLQANKGKKKKATWLFNLQYNSGIIMPGLVCNF